MQRPMDYDDITALLGEAAVTRFEKAQEELSIHATVLGDADARRAAIEMALDALAIQICVHAVDNNAACNLAHEYGARLLELVVAMRVKRTMKAAGGS